jgi:riboflavin transporter FmnP
MTRAAMLLWSAASGLIVGLLGGVALLALVTLVVNVLPGISERFVDRMRVPVLVLLLVLVPLAAAIIGYLEGRAKL